jgi:hypothetical protein
VTVTRDATPPHPPAPETVGGQDTPASVQAQPVNPALEDVLASIRALVSSETSARLGRGDAEAPVLMLTPEMRIDTPRPLDDDGSEPVQDGELLARGIGEHRIAPDAAPAPILDEEALRAVVNRIVREELQGELGDRIGRNLRKLIRREMNQLAEERREP